MLQHAEILKNIAKAKNIYEMVIKVPEIAKAAKPGQFVNVRLTDKLDPLLRRPISLHKIDIDNGTISMLYMVVGEGTQMMSQMKCGETIDVLGPLGNGWGCDFKGNNAVIIGGGIGIAPLMPLAQSLVSSGKNVRLIIGAKNKDFLTDTTCYKEIGVDVQTITDDGSMGRKGFVTTLLDEAIAEGKCDYIYACGPVPMLKFVEKIAIKNEIQGEVSMESHMGCGLGVCLLCPVKVKSGGYKRTCTDGPIFAIGVINYD